MSALRGGGLPSASFILGMLWLATVGCEGLGCGDGALAVLQKRGAGVERDHATSQLKWRPATEGDRFLMGDGLRTPKTQRAELSLLPSGGMRVEPGTLVRFQATPPGETRQRVRVDSGEISLDTGDIEIDIDTGDGLARVAPGSRVRVGSGEDGLQLRVEVGQLRMERDGAQVTLGAGEQITVEVGDLQLEPPGQPPPPPPPSARAPAPDAGASRDAAIAEGLPGQGEPGAVGPGVFANPPAQAALRLPLGEIATVHDPAPPTTVALSLPCSGLGVIEIGHAGAGFEAGRVRAQGEVRARLSPGNYRYRVRCEDGDQVVMGRVGIRRDAGTRALPRRAPRVTVDADGRPYTVRYQNLLPELTFAWPGAPAAKSFTLRVTTPSGKVLTRKGDAARLTVPSGQLAEGRHTFVIEAAGQRSRQGVLKIDFDNTARTAYLSSPREGSAAVAGPVRVAGAALAGSEVSVEGQPVAVSREGRFQSEHALSEGSRVVAVRVRHPSSGVHYYLRHLE